MARIMVETFEVGEENIEGKSLECEAEALELIKALNLEGQMSLTKRDETGEPVGDRIPYRKMTVEENKVYGALLTEATSVEKYADALIPLRVLQIISHCRDMGYFDKMQVWHQACEIKDPVLVGRKVGDTWQSPLFILARWGEVLLPFEELKKKAVEVIREKLISDNKRHIRQAQSNLESIPSMLPNEILEQASTRSVW